MLRDFLRSVVFERFLVAVGVCAGIAQALLVAWAVSLVAGLGAVPLAPLAGLAAGLALLQGWATPRLSTARPTSWLGRRAVRAYLAIGFSAIALATVLAAYAVLVGGAAALLAAAGLPGEAGSVLFRGGSITLAIGATAALLWGFRAGSAPFQVTHLRVALPGLAPALAGLRIAHLSDLHIGNGLEGARLAGLVASVNALEPDLVAISGDLFDRDPAALAGGARALAGLQAPLGVHAVLGNHDLFAGREAVAAALAAHAPGLALLRGHCVRPPARAPLTIAGLDDPGRDWTAGGRGLPALEALAAAAGPDGLRILLVHRPDAFPQAARLGFQLVLAGHFHGGQVAVPVGRGRWNVARLLTPFHRGLYRRGGAALYVSRGLGFAGPRIRLGSAPEIALLELEAEAPLSPRRGAR